MRKTAIEWTDATWNPSTGCTKISQGCRNCYSERLSLRLKKMGLRKYRKGFKFTIHPDALEIPLKWRKPRKIFVNSMSDLFHEKMSGDFLVKIFDIMKNADWHNYQILTKRPERMLNYVMNLERTIPDHIWMGVTVENADCKSRIDVLRKIPVKIRFISFEPLLDAIGKLDLKNISWVIVGGESGPKYRNMKTEWIREIRDQAKDQNVMFFFKQWGGLRAKSGGRLLDGKYWNEHPS